MSSFSIGQMNQLGNALEKAGFTAGSVTVLGQSDQLPDLLGVLRGTHEIKLKTRNWREQDGVIYLSVTSDGTTGLQWIERLEDKGHRLSDYAKITLHSPDFNPTSGVTTEIAILKGVLFEDNDRITKKIRAEADKRKLTTPNAEVACLIRENFSDEEIEAMGLWWIVAMHEPIKDSDGGPSLLGASRNGGGRWLSACCDGPDDGWDREGGFAFVVSQVASDPLNFDL